tara:strand:+ start:147 stop:446 length:300 start_codon:yes stop_codon:yes gene_type:complete
MLISTETSVKDLRDFIISKCISALSSSRYNTNLMRTDGDHRYDALRDKPLEDYVRAAETFDHTRKRFDLPSTGEIILTLKYTSKMLQTSNNKLMEAELN